MRNPCLFSVAAHYALKMAALVADYGSDSNESDNASDSLPPVEMKQNVLQTDGTNLLMAREDALSSSDEDSDDREQDKTHATAGKLPNPLLPDRLPNPMADPNEKGLSVFSNPFEQAELAKKSVLEKHVRLTEAAPERGNRPICFKFKKGACHMGKNCRFYHDPNYASPLGLAHGEAGEASAGGQDAQSKPPHRGGAGSTGGWAGRGFSGGALPPDTEDSDSYMASAKRKKRTGVGDSLMPPKRAMMELQKQRSQERPWTVQK